MDEQTLNDGKVLLLAVAYQDKDNVYTVDIAEGASVSEVAFAMMVVIKCLLKDGVIENSKVVTDLIDKYLNDPQYDEVKQETEDN